MQEFMKRVKERISKGILDKDVWVYDLLGLEATITDWLNQNGYDSTIALSDTSQVFNNDTDVRLNNATRLLETIKENKEKGLNQGVMRAKTRLETLFEYYRIGYLKDCRLKNSGLYIELNLGVMNFSCMDDKKETQRLKFQQQLRTLEDYGFDLEKRKYGNDNVFKNTNKNKDLLITLLHTFGISHLEFHTSESEIITVTGRVDLETFFHYDIPKLNMDVDTETEKKNKLILLDKRFKELCDSISTINAMPQMVNTCGYLIEHYLVDIDKALGIETDLCHKVENYHNAERLKNQRIHEIEKKIGEALSGKELMKLGKTFFDRMGNSGLKEIGFDISHESSYIEPYGTHLKYRALSIDHMMYSFDSYSDTEDEADKGEEEKTIQFIEKTFDLIEPFKNERYIAYSENNMKHIMEWVNTKFHTTIESLEIGNKKNLLYIKSFSVLLDNF